MKTVRFIEETVQPIDCQACLGKGKIYGHVCYICSGKGQVTIKSHSDRTDEIVELLRLKDLLLKYENIIRMRSTDRVRIFGSKQNKAFEKI